MDNPSRIFVSGIPVRIDKQGIVDFFSQFGAIKYCKIKKNSKTGRSLGYAYITIEILLDYFKKIAKVSHAYVLKDPESEFNKGYGYVAFPSQEALQEFVKRKQVLHLMGAQIRYSDHMKTPPKKRRQKPVQDLCREAVGYSTPTLSNSRDSKGSQIQPSILPQGFIPVPSVIADYPLLMEVNDAIYKSKAGVEFGHSPFSAATTILGGGKIDFESVAPSQTQTSKMSISSEESEDLIQLTKSVIKQEKPKPEKLYSPWGWTACSRTAIQPRKISREESGQSAHCDRQDQSASKDQTKQDQIFDESHSANGTHFIKPTKLHYSRVKRVDERTVSLIEDFFASHEQIQQNYKYNGLTKATYLRGVAAVDQ